MKKIGILSNSTTGVIGLPYIKLITKIGAMPILIPYMKQTDEEIELMVDNLDGLIIPGGIDISPKSYGDNLLHSKLVSYDFDDWQLRFLDTAFQKKKKIFGICRGHQLINVYFNGKLVQDIEEKAELDEEIITVSHNQNDYDIARSETTHQLKCFNKEGYLPSFCKYKDGEYVNSMHHQAVTEEYLGDELIALFETDGVIEVMVHKSETIFSVQFHPEEFKKKDFHSTKQTLQKFFGISVKK